MKISDLMLDENKEEHGVWVPVGKGLEVKVARLGNKACRQFLINHDRASLLRNSSEAIKFIGDNKELDDVLLQAVSKFILLDWKNLQDDAGQDIPYSSEKAYELLKSSSIFLEIVVGFAQDLALFKVRKEEQDRKN